MGVLMGGQCQLYDGFYLFIQRTSLAILVLYLYEKLRSKNIHWLSACVVHKKFGMQTCKSCQ